MTKSYKRGFTLIELLVVIAIIGLLAAVVLASLGSARAKGADAAVKAQLSALRTSMELYSSNNGGSYNGGCGSTPIINAITNANSSAGKGGTVNTSTTTAGAWNLATCHVDGTNPTTAWAADAPLNASVSGTPSMWCVDSTGAAKVETAALAASVGVCT